MYLQWQCIGMVMFYTLIKVSCGLALAHLFQSYARAEIGLHWYVDVVEFCGQSLHVDNVLLTWYGLIHF